VRLLILLASCLLAGCSHSPELTVLWGPRRYEGHEDTAITFMLLQRIGKHTVVGCTHQSEPQHGRPLNDDAEETFDSCGLGARFGGKPK
jgi:hypothetical protein